MFTGIIETRGTVDGITRKGDGLRLRIRSNELGEHLEKDDSVAVNGICLTVVERSSEGFSADAVAETLARTTLKDWRPGQTVNLERGMPASGRFDGHLVQGHVDGTAELITREGRGGGAEMTFRTAETLTALMVEKGSVALDGVSLTIVSVTRDRFSVAVIPYTLSHTTLGDLPPGGKVNVEMDIIGKYLAKFSGGKLKLTKTTLEAWGYKL